MLGDLVQQNKHSPVACILMVVREKSHLVLNLLWSVGHKDGRIFIAWRHLCLWSLQCRKELAVDESRLMKAELWGHVTREAEIWVLFESQKRTMWQLIDWLDRSRTEWDSEHSSLFRKCEGMQQEMTGQPGTRCDYQRTRKDHIILPELLQMQLCQYCRYSQTQIWLLRWSTLWLFEFSTRPDTNVCPIIKSNNLEDIKETHWM